MHTPQLDHYVGRTIKKVEQGANNFTLILEGNKRIHITGTPPAGLESGMEFMEVGVDDDNRELRFCQRRKNEIVHQESVWTQQGDYTISDEDHPQKRVDPSIANDEITSALPADPSPDRDKGATTRGDD